MYSSQQSWLNILDSLGRALGRILLAYYKGSCCPYLLHCKLYKAIKPMQHVTLFHFQTITTWGNKVYRYLTNSVVFAKIHKHRQIHKQYLIIRMGNWYYMCENDYIQVLNYVHVRVGSSHFSGCSINSQIIYY